MSAPRWRYVSGEDVASDQVPIPRGVYLETPGEKPVLRLLVLRFSDDPSARDAFGREVADLLNTKLDAEETIRMKDRETPKGEPS